MPTVRKTSHVERTKQKLRDANIIERLIKFINGEVEMTSVQVNACLRLANKIMPELKAVEQTITDNRSRSRDELLALISNHVENPEELWQSVSKH